MARRFELPASRSFSATAWVNVAAQAGDDTLDRLAGYRGPVDATSSGRLDGKPRWRASQAFDGDPRTAWIAAYGLGGPAWLQWRAKSELSVSTLRLAPPTELVRRPTEVRLQWPTGSTPPLAVGPDGSVVLPHRVRARVFRLVVLSARAPAGASAADQGAVGIAEVSGVGGLPTIRIPSTARFSAPCGSAVVRIGRVRACAERVRYGDGIRGRRAAVRPVVWPAARARRRNGRPGRRSRAVRGRSTAPLLAGSAAGLLRAGCQRTCARQRHTRARVL